ncbi:MAG: CheD [Magnetococcales bacterium]|nr:CheD [Magnetococcales bacterium]HIJ84451.1 chemotaxis protein CheD [Magnetococcales bacterium]
MATNLSDHQVVNLDPGELFVGTRPAEVHTVLGSCVSVVLFHPHHRMGAMSHGKLPTRPCNQPYCGLKICRMMGDFVSCSLHFMLSWFYQMGIPGKELEVKLFGGAMMFSIPNNPQEQSIAVGKRNVETAMDIIRAEKLHLIASDVGGPWGRKLVFHTGTGEVKLQRIRKTVFELASMSG